MTPLVTVVIPTHDRPEELSRAIRSVLAQTMTDWEAIVVDDNSLPAVTGNAPELADPRIHLTRLEPGMGVSGARNHAIGLAQGNWVAFLDDDDMWAPHKLELQLAEAEAHGAGFVYSDALRVDRSGRIREVLRTTGADDLTRKLLPGNAVGGPSTVLVRTDVLRRTDGFHRELAVSADWDMWVRLSVLAPAFSVQQPLVALLFHAESMQVTKVERIRPELELMCERHAALLADLDGTFGGARFDLWLARLRFRAAPSWSNARQCVAAELRNGRVLTRGRRRIVKRLSRRGSKTPAWVQELLA